jgi:hypothetical protein
MLTMQTSSPAKMPYVSLSLKFKVGLNTSNMSNRKIQLDISPFAVGHTV